MTRSLLDALPVPILVWGEERLRLANAPALKLIGAPLEQIRGVAREQLLQARSSGEGCELWRSDGSQAPIVREARFEWEGQPMSILEPLVAPNLTHCAEEARPTVAPAGAAHEINNPLAYVLGSLELADRVLSGSNKHQLAVRDLQLVEKCVSNALDGVERIRRIVRELLSDTRTGNLDAEQGVDIEMVLDSCIDLAWNEIRHRARLVKQYAHVPRARGDHARLGQVFVNLLINAAHAIPEGRALDHEIRIRTATAPTSVMVEVEDTGSGMNTEVLARVFEPYFTTKPQSLGTGLGLSITREIVHRLGGDIQVSSTPLVGTRVRVQLPTAPDIAASETAQSPVAPLSGKRLLVVDDEPLLGQTLRMALQSQHDVQTATSGREALAVLQHDRRFDLILCDLMMPDVSGMEVARSLQQNHPELESRLVLMTGGAFSSEARAFMDNYRGRRLDKPFTTQDIDALLQELESS